MKELTDIESYLTRLKQDQRNIPQADRANYPEVQVVNDALAILTSVDTPQQFVAELQSKRNLTNHEDKAYLQELKNWYNNVIDYANEEADMKKDNWETDEVINWLTNDEDVYNELFNKSAEEIKAWVIEGNAPNGLYQSFNRPPQSSFRDVDWEEVAASLEG